MKFSWIEKTTAGTNFHYVSVGDVRCGMIVESMIRNKRTGDGPGWQVLLPNHPHGHASGRAKSLSSAKRMVEAEIEEWFERTGLL